jgi:hypothetical protein
MLFAVRKITAGTEVQKITNYVGCYFRSSMANLASSQILQVHNTSPKSPLKQMQLGMGVLALGC